MGEERWASVRDSHFAALLEPVLWVHVYMVMYMAITVTNLWLAPDSFWLLCRSQAEAVHP
jgi:hypothetical protein